MGDRLQVGAIYLQDGYYLPKLGPSALLGLHSRIVCASVLPPM
jgi:hypothetical protein